MGGWIVAKMHADPLQDRRRAFEKTFSVAGVPALHTELHSLRPDCHVLLWAWAKPPVPDVVFARGDAGDTGLVLCGAITDFGKYGPVPRALEDVAASLLRLYAQHGRAVLPELNGSFSLAFVNAAHESITLFTDRFASRSVWFTRGTSNRVAANFPSAIAALMPQPPALDPAGFWALFASGRHVGRRGLYDGIHNLQAGENVELRGAEAAAVSAWYQLRYTPERGRSVKDWGAEVASRLRTSADRLSAVTPEPYLFLSGGLDSRIAASALRERTNTVTLASSRNMNARIASKVADHVGATHQTVDRTPYWYLDSFEAASLASGGNYNIKHAHFMVPVHEIRSEHPGAAFLLGDLLENFNKHYFKELPDGSTTFQPERVPDYFHRLYSYAHKDPHTLKRLFRPEIVGGVEASWRSEIVQLCRAVHEVSPDARDCLDALFRWYNVSMCPTYMMLECITPLASERNLMFDNDLHDLYRRVPPEVRGSERTHPWTLWNIDRRLALMPDANAWQPPIGPKSLKKLAKRIRPVIGRTRRQLMSWRRKQPATRTEGSWQMMQVSYRVDPKYREFIESCLFDERCLPPEIFDRAAVEQCWQEFLCSDSADTYEIDVLLSFGLLHRRIPTSGLH